MKRRRVVWSRNALDGLKQALVHIAADNPAAARRVGAAVRACGTSLGKAATGRPGRIVGTYEKVVPRLPYILAYTLHPTDEEAVVILHVIHGARDWTSDHWPEEN